MATPKKVIREKFPNLGVTDFKVTSPDTPAYNCIAWAAGNDTRFWWPAHDGFWPEGIPREESLDAFKAAFAALAYQPCADGAFDALLEKVAIYVDAGGKPTHAARQLESGRWTSKLGQFHDIEHKTTHGVEGAVYGKVGLYMSRPRA